MPFLKNLLSMGIIMIFLNGCMGPSLEKYNQTSPKMDFKEYFNGPILAWGIVQDWRGNVKRQFKVEMVGTWNDNIGTLKEKFDYYDGKTDYRTWTVTKISDNSYEGTAGDIKGLAKGQSNGNALRWKYNMNLDVGEKTYLITFDDWMFQMKDGVLINKSYLKKFGVTVAELTIFMQKQDVLEK